MVGVRLVHKNRSIVHAKNKPIQGRIYDIRARLRQIESAARGAQVALETIPSVFERGRIVFVDVGEFSRSATGSHPQNVKHIQRDSQLHLRIAPQSDRSAAHRFDHIRVAQNISPFEREQAQVGPQLEQKVKLRPRSRHGRRSNRRLEQPRDHRRP